MTPDIFATQPNTNIEPIEAFCVAVQQVFFWPCVAVLVLMAAFWSGRWGLRLARWALAARRRTAG